LEGEVGREEAPIDLSVQACRGDYFALAVVELEANLQTFGLENLNRVGHSASISSQADVVKVREHKLEAPGSTHVACLRQDRLQCCGKE